MTKIYNPHDRVFKQFLNNIEIAKKFLKIQKYFITSGSWFINYVQSNLHYVYYFANIINNQEFTKKLETIEFVKQENIMGAMARKIEQQGIEKGIEQGIERGVERNKKETARIMLAEGADLNFIVKVTKLTIEEINKLKE